MCVRGSRREWRGGLERVLLERGVERGVAADLVMLRGRRRPKMRFKSCVMRARLSPRTPAAERRKGKRMPMIMKRSVEMIRKDTVIWATCLFGGREERSR